MIKYFVFSLVIALSLSSCSNDTVFEQNTAIDNRSWGYDQKPSFAIDIKDNTAKYNIYINLRHTGNYDYSNIYVLLHEKGNKLTDTAYRKEIRLAELDGRWLGKSAASLYEIEYLAKENFTFPDTGVYTFSVEQNMRENPLKDIADIGIKVTKK